MQQESCAAKMDDGDTRISSGYLKKMAAVL